MKITDVRVDGFGVWSGLEIRDLSRNMTVFFGRNEAGKTTLMQFIRTVLYGFSRHRRSRYLPPLHGTTPGGSLRVASASGRFELVRKTHAGDSAKSPGELIIRSEEGTVQGSHQLLAMCGDIDESIFNNVFAVGLRELQELGSLNDTEAAEQLYKMTSGMDRVSLVDVTRKLSQTRRELLSDEDENSHIGELCKKRESLERELEELSQGTRRWTSLAAQKTSLQHEIAQLEQKSEELDRGARLIEIARQASDPWSERANVLRRLESMGAVAELPMDAIRRVGQINELMERRHTRLDELMTQRELVREEAKKLPINRDLWRHAARVEALCEHTQWIASLTNQINRIRPEVEEFETELEAQRMRLGISTGAGNERLPEVNSEALASLRTPAKRFSDAKKQLELAEEERDAFEAELDKATSRFKRAMTDRETSDLAKTIANAETQVDTLKRRIEVEHRLDKMGRHRRELDEDRLDLMDAQILHPHHHVICGAFVVIGLTFFLSSLLFPNSFGGPLGVLGMVGGAAASLIGVIFKYMMEQSAEEELRDCERELRAVDDQIKRAHRDRDELDRNLPTGGGSLDRRLAEAEEHLASLQDMTPLEDEIQTVEGRFEQIEKAVQAARRDKDKAETHWRETLMGLGLPKSLSPADIRKLGSSFDTIRSTRKQLEIRREELQARERELDTVLSRIDQLFQETGLEPSSKDPLEQLRQLADELSAQKKLMERRNSLKRQFRLHSREAEKYGRNMRKLSVERAALLDQAGVNDEDALSVLANRFEKFQGLTQDRERLNEQLGTIIGPHFQEEEIAGVFSQYGEARLESAWERTNEELTAIQKSQTSLHQELGAVTQEMKALTVDRRPAEIRLELDAVNQQLQDAIRQWQVLAVAGLLLESTRQIYETERQPETLREASHFLKDLTDGQYCRVWTPLEQDTLMVDDSRGDSLSVDFLSRGTRESVFLSLRLALASAYARRGAILPLILDDVLVNLDARRARAAVRVLSNFSDGQRQSLIFTCHEHIVEMFAEAGVEIRELPPHAEIAGIVEPSVPVAKLEEPPEEEVEEYEEELLEEPEDEEEIEVAEQEEEEEDAVEEEELVDEADEEEAYDDDEEYEEEEELVDEADEEDEYEEDEYEEEEYEEEEYEEEEDEDEEDEVEASFTWESPDMWNSSPADGRPDEGAEGEAA